MTDDHKVFAVVVTFNGSPWIRKCIESLESSSYPVQIIVVDNNSTDDTPRFLEIRTSLQYVALKDNLGFGRANNIGMRKALAQGADYVFLLNQDAYVKPDTIEKLIKCMSKNPALGVLSPLHLTADGDAIDPYFAQYIVTRGAEQFYSDLLFGHVHPEEEYFLSFVNAAAWMISAQCLKTVGGFDPLFHMYGEDDDYCRRVLRHGFQIGMLPSTVVCHARGKGGHLPEERDGLRAVWATYSREKSRDIRALKAPGNFLRITALWYLGLLYAVGEALINRDVPKLVAKILLGPRLTLLLPKIYAHRRKGDHPGPIWLD